jgi:hypothetical protein
MFLQLHCKWEGLPWGDGSSPCLITLSQQSPGHIPPPKHCFVFGVFLLVYWLQHMWSGQWVTRTKACCQRGWVLFWIFFLLAVIIIIINSLVHFRWESWNAVESRKSFASGLASIYVVPSVFITIIKFTPVKLSEVIKKCFINHLTVVVMTNLIHLWNNFMERAVQNEK